MSIESDASKWKSNVSRILEVDPEGILLTETVKKYFDEVASVFKKGTFDAENTKKLLKVLRGRNTRLSGKPIAVELSSFVNITERYATKTEGVFADFAKALALSSTSPRTHQVQSSRQNPLSDSLDFSELEELDRIFSESDGPANESPSRTPPQRSTPTIPRSRLNSLVSIENNRQPDPLNRVIESSLVDEADKKSKAPWVIAGVILVVAVLIIYLINGSATSSTVNPINSRSVNNATIQTPENLQHLRSRTANSSKIEPQTVVKGEMTDSRNVKKYKTVKIGDQIWMAENLNYKTRTSYCYDNKESNCSKYGRLYEWKAAIKACPSGWHLPSKVEFETLFTAVGDQSSAGKVLKSLSGWNGTDAYGFSVLPAGDRYYRDGFYDLGRSAYFWRATEYGSGSAYRMSLNDNVYVGLDYYYKSHGFSVRCLKN